MDCLSNFMKSRKARVRHSNARASCHERMDAFVKDIVMSMGITWSDASRSVDEVTIYPANTALL